jgi:hypothetical protein
MPPVAAALLPHPPLLVPELAGAAAAELDPLRAACRTALSTVLAAADLIIVVGDGPVWGVPEPAAAGSFRPYGADLEVALPALVDLDLPGLPPPARLADLPLSLAVAAHLLAGLDPPATNPAAVPAVQGPPPARLAAVTTVPAFQSPSSARLAAVTVPASLGPGAAAAIGRTLAAAAQAVGTAGLVVMGDLSACRTERSPGAFREDAGPFDASVTEAFRSAGPARLLDLDPARAADLLVAGRVPLQVLAGAFQDGRVAGAGARGDPRLRGRVLYDDAPYGVGYLVALLTLTAP